MRSGKGVEASGLGYERLSAQQFFCRDLTQFLGRCLHVRNASVRATWENAASPVTTKIQIDHQHHVVEMIGGTLGSEWKGDVRFSPSGRIRAVACDVCRNLASWKEPHLEPTCSPLGGKHTASILIENRSAAASGTVYSTSRVAVASIAIGIENPQLRGVHPHGPSSA